MLSPGSEMVPVRVNGLHQDGFHVVPVSCNWFKSTEPGGAFCSPAPLGPPLVRFSRPGRGEDMTGLGGHMRGFPAAAAWFPS